MRGCTRRRVVGCGLQGLDLQPRPRGRFSRRHRKTGASGVKRISSPRWTTDSRLTFGRLPDRAANFKAQLRGRGPMPRNSRRWAAALQMTPRWPRRNPGHGFSLNCANTYKQGCSASAARQAGGGAGERWSSHGPCKGQPQARTVGGWFVHGGRDGQAEMRSAKSHRTRMWVRTCDPTPSKGKLRMNSSDKPTPIASLPDNWSTFNGHEVMPWGISRAEIGRASCRERVCVPV